MAKYKKLKWSKLLKNGPFHKACKSSDKHLPFTIGEGKGQKIFYFIIEGFFKNTQNDEYIYVDRKREELVRTRIVVGDGQAKCEQDLRNWEETYNKGRDQHEVDVQKKREKALKKAREARKKK